jgi:hypothetical protein
MLECKACEAVQDILARVALMHMCKTKHSAGEKGEQGLTPSDQFDSLAV